MGASESGGPLPNYPGPSSAACLIVAPFSSPSRHITLGNLTSYDQITLVLVKPGGVRRGLTGEILRRIEARGLRIAGLHMLVAERTTVEEHYAEHVDKPFFKSVCDYLTSGPSVAVAVVGPNAVLAIRAMMAPRTPWMPLRAPCEDLALEMGDNLVHSSSDPRPPSGSWGSGSLTAPSPKPA